MIPSEEEPRPPNDPASALIAFVMVLLSVVGVIATVALAL